MALSRRALLAFVATGVLVLAAVGGTLTQRLRGGSEATDLGPRLVFAEFSANADRIYTAPAADPARRTLVTTVEHAADWGLNPALAPAGALVAFTVLPASARPQPDSPAEVWVLDVSTGVAKRLAGDADLRVPPVFDPAGSALVYRSSASGGRQSLVRIDLASGTRRALHEAETAFGIFPVGFAKDGSLVFASLSNAGTDFFRTAEGRPPERLLHASDQIVRDWRLSPDGAALAYLAPQISAERVVYRVQAARLDGGDATPAPLPAPQPGGEQYGVAWRPSADAITVGQQPSGSPSAAAVTLALDGGEPSTLTPPARGFDQPLGWSGDGTALVVRSFDGSSAASPGRESIAVIESGQRRVVAGSGEIIYLGWLPR